jgi:hypothetical protein
MPAAAPRDPGVGIVHYPVPPSWQTYAGLDLLRAASPCREGFDRYCMSLPVLLVHELRPTHVAAVAAAVRFCGVAAQWQVDD